MIQGELHRVFTVLVKLVLIEITIRLIQAHSNAVEAVELVDPFDEAGMLSLFASVELSWCEGEPACFFRSETDDSN